MWGSDEDMSNPKALWEAIGSPSSLKPAEATALKAAAVLHSTPVKLVRSADGQSSALTFPLPAFGLAVLDVSLSAPSVP